MAAEALDRLYFEDIGDYDYPRPDEMMRTLAAEGRSTCTTTMTRPAPKSNGRKWLRAERRRSAEGYGVIGRAPRGDGLLSLSLSLSSRGVFLFVYFLLKCSKVTLLVQKESRPAGPEHDYISSLPLSALTPPVQRLVHLPDLGKEHLGNGVVLDGCRVQRDARVVLL